MQTSITQVGDNSLLQEMEMRLPVFLTLILLTPTFSAAESKYRDGRPEATLRMEAEDHGIVLRYGDGPGKCDMLGARDAWVFESDGTYYMHYDAPGGTSTSHMRRHIGLAWLDLPLPVPCQE